LIEIIMIMHTGGVNYPQLPEWLPPLHFGISIRERN
jgi:hypothetical protein